MALVSARTVAAIPPWECQYSEGAVLNLSDGEIKQDIRREIDRNMYLVQGVMMSSPGTVTSLYNGVINVFSDGAVDFSLSKTNCQWNLWRAIARTLVGAVAGLSRDLSLVSVLVVSNL